MASKTLKVTIKQRYDTEANWTTNNPVLASGEIAFSSDKSCDYKVGDGIKTWSQLSYQNASLYSAVLAAASQYSDKAKNDNLDQQIDSTYIKGLSASGSTITYTKGNGTTGTVTVDGGGSDFTGATSDTDGTAGKVIKPVAGKQNSFLKGNGTWSELAGGDIKSGTIDDARLGNVSTTATTSTDSPAHGSSFTAIDSITTDTKGRVTAVNTKTVTLPSNDNQNAFSNVKVGEDTIAADSSTDTLELVAGTNVTLTADTTNDKVTIASTDTDRYVNSATFADDSTNTAASPLKMTLTRAGSDSGTVVANLPKVSASSAGVAPKGASVTSQGQDTKFLREDGSWAVPSYTTDTNTTYTFAGTADGISVTPSNGSATTYELTSVSASKITGVLSIDNIPASALERVVTVANDTARFALTTSDVQLGDTVKVTATKKMYMVKDTSNLDSEAGYEEYVTSTDWSVVANKPTTYAGYGLSVGSGLTGASTGTIDHADTSSQSSITASSRTYINAITLDDYGHVTALSTGTETVVDTDRYVNSATFADDSTNTAASPVKMTLTRAGSDSATVTGNIPKVSASTAGVVPKGAVVATQDSSTKFLREDGSWAVPSYTANTDRYVNSASFEDDTTANASSPVKMTLTRAGSDSATVTGNLPKVSSSTAGVVPKGAVVATQDSSTKFLREDGTWAVPSYPAASTDTWRAINLSGTEILGSATSTNALNFVPGSGINITNSSGSLTFALDSSAIPAPATIDCEVD